MSMPKISDISPKISISREDAVTITIASIAMEELALAHILNAEGEKLQYVLGTLDGRTPDDITTCDIMAVNKSIQNTLRDVIKTEMLLQFKLDDAASLIATEKCRNNITVTITWRDSDNVAGIRPLYVKVNLLRDGVVYDTATIDTAGDNKHTFTCVPVWENSKHKYEYKVDLTEDPEDYTKTIDGLNIINTIEPGVRTVEGKKIWADNKNAGNGRPTEITVNLLQKGDKISSIKVASPQGDEDTAEFSFDNVPWFDKDGKEIVYTVDEDVVAGYTKSITGFNITNTPTTL